MKTGEIILSFFPINTGTEIIWLVMLKLKINDNPIVLFNFLVPFFVYFFI